MELIRGVPITDYCDANRLSVRARLAMFADVCRAVQHAHLRGAVKRGDRDALRLLGYGGASSYEPGSRWPSIRLASLGPAAPTSQ